MARIKYLEAEIMTVARTDKGTAVLVKPKEGDKVVPIFIGQLEAHSILIGLGHVAMPRPLTHDLFLSIFDKMKVVFQKVEIVDLIEGTFLANIIVSHGTKKLQFDSRPSDALALVSRRAIPLFISSKIVDEAGIPVSMISEENSAGFEPEAELDIDSSTEMSLDLLNLEIRLNQALEAENYEEAAKIRDELSKLEPKE